MSPEDRALLEENKALVLELLRRLFRASGGRESETSTLLFTQLGIVEWWLNATDSPMPARNRQMIAAWTAEMRLNIGRGFDWTGKRGPNA